MKKWMLFIAILSLLLSIAGCGAQEADEKEINVDKMLLCYYHECGEVYTTGMQNTDLGVEFGLKIENLADCDLRVTSSDLSVNGFMLPTSGLNVEVERGKIVRAAMILSERDLTEAGVTTVAELSFRLNFYASKTGELLDRTGVMILHTSAPMDYVQPVFDGGEEIVCENGLRVVCKGLRNDRIWDGDLVFHFENDLYKDVTFFVEDITVNGTVLEEGLHTQMNAFTKCVLSMDLEDADDVETIEYTIRAVDSYGKVLVSTETITMHAE